MSQTTKKDKLFETNVVDVTSDQIIKTDASTKKQKPTKMKKSVAKYINENKSKETLVKRIKTLEKQIESLDPNDDANKIAQLTKAQGILIKILLDFTEPKVKATEATTSHEKYKSPYVVNFVYYVDKEHINKASKKIKPNDPDDQDDEDN